MNTAVTSPPLNTAPSGPTPASADQARWLARVGIAIWDALEALGRARAHRHLLEVADRCEALQPDLAKELRAASRYGPPA